jgi:hypothetical protein
MMKHAMCVEAWSDGDLLLVYTNISYLRHLPPPATQSPVTALQTRTVLSPLADTIFRSSGLNPADITSSVCPSIVSSQLSVAPSQTSQTRTVVSLLAGTIFRP